MRNDFLAPARRPLLREVARRYSVAVVSGRAFRDLLRLVPIPGVVRVGPGQSAAQWRLASQADVDELLARLVDLREPRNPRRRKRP